MVGDGTGSSEGDNGGWVTMLGQVQAKGMRNCWDLRRPVSGNRMLLVSCGRALSFWLPRALGNKWVSIDGSARGRAGGVCVESGLPARSDRPLVCSWATRAGQGSAPEWSWQEVRGLWQELHAGPGGQR